MTIIENEKPFGIDEIVKIAGLAASLSLPASLIFDWGYYDAMGISLRHVPTSIVDHAKSAVFWFPFALFMGGWLTASRMLLVRLEGAIGPRPQSATTNGGDIARRWDATRKKVRRLYRTVFAAGGACILGYFALGEIAFIFLIMGLSALWVAFATWCVLHPGALRQWTLRTITCLTFVPPAILTLWGVGDMAGTAVHFAPLSTRVTVAGAAPQNVAVIRYLDKGLLARTSDGSVRFFQWPVITNIESPAKFDENDGLLCNRLHRCYWSLVDHYKYMH